jgi:hypothetical protein
MPDPAESSRAGGSDMAGTAASQLRAPVPQLAPCPRVGATQHLRAASYQLEGEARFRTREIRHLPSTAIRLMSRRGKPSDGMFARRLLGCRGTTVSTRLNPGRPLALTSRTGSTLAADSPTCPWLSVALRGRSPVSLRAAWRPGISVRATRARRSCLSVQSVLAGLNTSRPARPCPWIPAPALSAICP